MIICVMVNSLNRKWVRAMRIALLFTLWLILGFALTWKLYFMFVATDATNKEKAITAILSCCIVVVLSGAILAAYKMALG